MFGREQENSPKILDEIQNFKRNDKNLIDLLVLSVHLGFIKINN